MLPNRLLRQFWQWFDRFPYESENENHSISSGASSLFIDFDSTQAMETIPDSAAKAGTANLQKPVLAAHWLIGSNNN